MKKYLMTLAAVLCCAMTTTMFVACGDDEEKSYDGYVYSVELDVLNSIGYSAEAATLQTAFYQAIGYDGNVYKTYNSSQDDAMKNACEAVKTQYANSIKSTFLRFYLVRDVIDVQGNRDKKTIAVYDFGTVTKTPHVKYSYATDYDEADVTGINQLTADTPSSLSADPYYYTLDGMRHTSPVPGINIHRGKKILVK